ncbi:hypothetical protein O5623_17770 [Escherichia coli]|nr:hypothetical protein [Escherichia coli]
MLGLLPEQHTSDETFLPWFAGTGSVLSCSAGSGWNTTPPVLVTLMVFVTVVSPQNTSLGKHSAHWFTLDTGPAGNAYTL